MSTQIDQAIIERMEIKATELLPDALASAKRVCKKNASYSCDS